MCQQSANLISVWVSSECECLNAKICSNFRILVLMKTKKTRKRLPICSPQIECFLLFYGFCHSRYSVGPVICKRTNWRAHLRKDNCFRFCYFPLGRSYQTFSWALSVQFIGHQWMKSNYHPFLSLHSPNYRWMWIKGMKHKILPKSRRNEALFWRQSQMDSHFTWVARNTFAVALSTIHEGIFTNFIGLLQEKTSLSAVPVLYFFLFK